jgi:DNA-binding PadR family transcriptional regulator
MGENRRIVKSFRERMVKSLLDVLILKSVRDGDSLTGYNMMMDFNEKFGVRLSSGTIYSTLYNLESKGLIRSQLKGRNRVYALTEKGESFIGALADDQQAQQFIVLLERPLTSVHVQEASEHH